MTPEEFINRWRGSTRKESSAAQQHFLDLCDLLEVPKPGDPGTDSDDYDFEKSVKKSDGSGGSADVWKRGCFAWEYKGPRKSLTAAYAQVKDYADALDNPPLLIVSDMQEIQIHTNFTNTVKKTTAFHIRDLIDIDVRRTLRNAFLDPEKLRPTETRETVTEAAAASIGALATKLRTEKGYEGRRVAHFLNKLVFCMFAEDIGLLPDYVFTEITEEAVKRPDAFERMTRALFQAMNEREGMFGTTPIPWFDGGLFSDDDVLPIDLYAIRDLAAAAHLDWAAIEPSIFGTLFERGLDPARRKEMASLFDAKADVIETSATRDLFADGKPDKAVGVHYTDPDKIMKIVEPVVLRPLRAEWDAVKAEVAKHRAAKDAATTDGAKTKAENAARDAYLKFRQRLGAFRVLDPACGSGNFLYLSLQHLKDFDLEVEKEARTLGLPADDQRVTPEAVMGIEINPYAAELAQVTIWIGEIQWQLKNGFGVRRRPILGKLAAIQCRDALLNPDGTEAKWPRADAIIGNPPFVGDRKMIGALGEEYVERLRRTYSMQVPGSADLVCYWFEKAANGISANDYQVVGLVATNSIRKGSNKKVLAKIAERARLFEAWSDEPWVIDGAAVRVSLVCFCSVDHANIHMSRLDGSQVDTIFPDLTAQSGASGVDLTKVRPQAENLNTSFVGDQKNGPFDIAGDQARTWLESPLNPHGRPNSDVLRPWYNANDITSRYSGNWIIDFGTGAREQDVAYYEQPFAYVAEHVKPTRVHLRRTWHRTKWWLHGDPRPALREKISLLTRYIATPYTAKHRLFVWLPTTVLPSNLLVAIARDDDTTFGVLSSRLHENWSLRTGNWLGVGNDPRYTPSTTFETFPFPAGLTPNIPAKDYTDDPRAQRIAAAAKRLNELRENWLNPPDLVKRVPEVVPGYPDRILPVSAKAEKELKKRTLTNLYNHRPAWLDNIHRELDEAVAAAYGWPAGLSDDEILARLLALNLERAKKSGD